MSEAKAVTRSRLDWTAVVVVLMGATFTALLWDASKRERVPTVSVAPDVHEANKVDPTYYFWTPSEWTEQDLAGCQRLGEEERGCDHNWCLHKLPDGKYEEINRIEDQLVKWGVSGWLRVETEGRTTSRKSCSRRGYIWRVLDHGDRLGHISPKGETGQQLLVRMLHDVFGNKVSSPRIWVERVEHNEPVMWDMDSTGSPVPFTR